MTKAELIRDMTRYCGGSSFITRTELTRYLGYSCPKRIDQYLQGADRVSTRYYIGDVAQNIINARCS